MNATTCSSLHSSGQFLHMNAAICSNLHSSGQFLYMNAATCSNLHSSGQFLHMNSAIWSTFCGSGQSVDTKFVDLPYVNIWSWSEIIEMTAAVSNVYFSNLLRRQLWHIFPKVRNFALCNNSVARRDKWPCIFPACCLVATLGCLDCLQRQLFLRHTGVEFHILLPHTTVIFLTGNYMEQTGVAATH
jgi:hypothetical protein